MATEVEQPELEGPRHVASKLLRVVVGGIMTTYLDCTLAVLEPTPDPVGEPGEHGCKKCERLYTTYSFISFSLKGAPPACMRPLCRWLH